jgi:hypothetical protein
MKLTPLEPTSRAGAGVTLGYSLLGKGKGAPTLCLSIHPDLVRKLKVKKGDPLRLDGDLKARMGQLTLVQAATSKAARRINVVKSGRGEFCIPWSGLVKDAFPEVEGMTPLEGAEVTAEGLLFQLPKK